MSAAVAAAVGIGAMLFVPTLRALTGWRARARSESATAKRAKADAALERAKLKKAVDRVRREERARAAAERGKATPVSTEKPPSPDEPLHRVEVTPAPAPTKPKADTLAKLGEEKPTKKVAAERLLAYVSRSIAEGRSSNLGTRGAPNAQVAEGQRGMGKLTVDGIYGDKTRARGKELTGKPWPARTSAKPAAKPAPAPAKPQAAKPAPAPAKPQAANPAATPVSAPRPGARDAKQAATDLLAYARAAIGEGKSSRLGSKAEPSEVVRAAQRDMGGLATDGIYGPATRKRGKELTGSVFPARA